MEYEHLLRNVLILLSIYIANGQVVTQPENMAVMVGSQAAFRCAGQTPDYMAWETTPTANRDGSVGPWTGVASFGNLLSGGVGYDLTTNSAPTGTKDETLTLLNATEGIVVRCQLVNAPERSTAYAQLIVVESDPVMTATVNNQADATPPFMENDYVEFTCQVAFRSELWAPTIVWRWVDNGNIVSEGVTSNNTDTVHAEYRLGLQMTPEHHDRKVKCVTSFGGPPSGAYPAGWIMSSVVPTFPSSNHEQQAETFLVQYGVREVELSAPSLSYVPGNQITCTATGYPSPTFTWTNTEDNAVLEHSGTVTITEEYEGFNRWICTAANTIGSDIYTETMALNFTVTIPTTTLQPTIPTGGPVGDCSSISAGDCCSNSGCGLCRLNTGVEQCRATSDMTDCDNICTGLAAGVIAGIVIGIILLIIIIIVIIYFCCCRRQAPTKGKAPASDKKQKPRMDGVDTIRKPDVAYIQEVPPPYSPYATGQPQRPESNGLMYANLALDDTPRSRKPIQVYEPTPYNNDFQRV